MKQHILIVEDNSSLRKKIKQLMELEGFCVTEASDGVEAIKFLENKIPDVILSDVEMPRMDGQDLLKYKVNNPELQNVPFILCSGVKSNNSTRNVKNNGADFFLSKPFRFSDLIKTVKNVIEKNKNGTYKEIQDWVLKRYYLQ